MKSISFVLTALLLLSTPACKKAGSSQTKGLIGLALLESQSSPQGSPGLTQTITDITSKGINLFGLSFSWSELENSPSTPFNGIAALNTIGSFKSYVLVIGMINTNLKTVPSDLSSLSFGDTVLINRFLKLVDTLSTFTQATHITHILLGNEVDAYLSANSSELAPFSVFYQQAINRVHAKMPWVKVGTITTFGSVGSPVFTTLTPYSDFICYTYYPVANWQNWQMQPPAHAASDIALMKQSAGSKPFAFTEIGYSSSAVNNSSEQQQKQFVETVFNTLRPIKNQGGLEFILYHGLYDYSPSVCGPYAQSQGVDSTYLCAFMNNIGLNSYTTSQPKQAWQTFSDILSSW